MPRAALHILDYPGIFTEVKKTSDEENKIHEIISIAPEAVGENKKAYSICRRAQDIVLCSIALVVLLPVLLLIAAIIYIDDPHGSPIFVQERIGKGGKPFKLFKFRSMVVDAEDRLKDVQSLNEKSGPAFKIRNDPRITRFGKFIRKTSLDELPQLVNVIKGDMSICGPRPPLRREVEQYDEYQMQRLCVAPGLTCYWQIQPNRDELSFDEWMELDLKYLRERSFIVDWKIIFATVGAMVKCHGA